VVAIKKIQYPYQLSRKHICDKLTHVSKLEHKNIVQLLGYGHGVLETTERFQDKKGSGFEDDLFFGGRVHAKWKLGQHYPRYMHFHWHITLNFFSPMITPVS
jgi:hypothetical protein